MASLSSGRLSRLAGVLCLVLVLGTGGGVQAGDRVALVIGNGNYQSTPLANPVNDAKDMASALRRVGFEVILRTDANLDEMLKAVVEFQGTLKGGSTALVYYAGHGVQLDGVNYLIPVGNDIRNVTQVRTKALATTEIKDAVSGTGAGTALLFLDCCRDNPYQGTARSAQRGMALEPFIDSVETFVSFAAASGQTAADGSAGHGVFTGALLNHLEDPGVELAELMRRVSAEVKEATQGAQQPRVDTGLTKAFYFVDPQAKLAQIGAANQAKKDEIAQLEKQIAEGKAKIATTKVASARQQLEIEQKKRTALLASKRIEAETLAQETERLKKLVEQDTAADADRQRQVAEAQKTQGDLAKLAARRRVEVEALNLSQGDPSVLVANYEGARAALTEVNSQFDRLWDNTLAGLNQSYSERLTKMTQDYPQEGWESDAEYTKRLEGLRAKVTAERDKTVKATQLELDAKKAKESAQLNALLATARTNLFSQTFAIQGDQVTVTPGAFDKITKQWPVIITATHPLVSLTQTVSLDLVKEADLPSAYRAWDTAFKAKGVIAELAGVLKEVKPAIYGITVRKLELKRLTDNKTVSFPELRTNQYVSLDPGSKKQLVRVFHYEIGDVGPAGGTIVYDKQNSSDGWRYLEVAPKDIARVKWGNFNDAGGNRYPVGGLRSDIGSGRANTMAIVKALGTDTAAYLCTTFESKGYKDWFLPSLGELTQLHKQRSLVPGVQLDNPTYGTVNAPRYWSSTEVDGYNSLVIQLDDSEPRPFGVGRILGALVRPFRMVGDELANPRQPQKVEERPAPPEVATVGTVTLEAPDPGCSITIDGQPVGSGRWKGSLSVGDHQVTVGASGVWVSAPSTLKVGPGENPVQKVDALRLGSPGTTRLGMVSISGRTISLGNGKHHSSENQSSVTVNSFALSKIEVTEAEWQATMIPGPQQKVDLRPTSQPSWYQALLFCNRLSENEGLDPCYKIEKGLFGIGYLVEWNQQANGYRLPTEAEWELAALSGGSGAGPVANTQDVAWYEGNSGREPHPVGTRKPTAGGLYDLFGNLDEWCWDGYSYPGADTAVVNPKFTKVYRGGYYGDGTLFGDFRGGLAADSGAFYVGFRVARNDLSPGKKAKKTP